MSEPNKIGILLCAALFALTACDSKPRADRKPADTGPPVAPMVIPVPRSFTATNGMFRVDARTPVVFSGGDGARAAAEYFVGLARSNPELPLTAPTQEDPKSNA